MNYRGIVGACWVLMLSNPLSALEFNFGLNGSSTFTDNARQIEEDSGLDAISERQDVYRFGVQALHSSERVNFQADYALDFNTFSEDSQQDRETRSGRSSLFLGRSTDIFTLALEHSVQLVLMDPTEVQLLENLEERSISQASPSLNLRLSAVDFLRFSYNFQDVSYDEEPFRNSTSKGLRSVWEHRLSNVSYFSLEASSQDVEFDEFPEAAYTLEYALLNYAVALRNLSYSFSVGGNKSTQENGESFNGGRFSLDLTYNAVTSEVGLRLGQRLSDTSQGDGNEPTLGESGQLDGDFSTLDQIELREAEVYWLTRSLCARCEFSIYLQTTEEEYLTASNLSNDERSIVLNLAYGLSRRSRLGLRYTDAERDFSDDAERDYESGWLTLSYQYSLSERLSLDISAVRETREYLDALGGELIENQFTLGLGYRF